MAWFLQLSMECGPDQAHAEAVRAFFGGEPIALSDGRVSRLNAFVLRDGERNFWCIVSPGGTHYGAGEKRFGDEATEQIVRQLYGRLQSAPPFRYAISGYETELFRTHAELKQELAAQDVAGLHGLVVQSELLAELPDASGFVPFAPGYCWQPMGRINFLVRG